MNECFARSDYFTIKDNSTKGVNFRFWGIVRRRNGIERKFAVALMKGSNFVNTETKVFQAFVENFDSIHQTYNKMRMRVIRW